MANVETTKFCNLRCRMCVQFLEGATVRGPHMELEHFKEIAQQVFPHVAVWQPSVAGEPVVTRAFDAMLDLAHEFGLGLHLTTNGTLAPGPIMERVARDRRDCEFSFDAPTKATFERIRVGAVFETVVSNIQALIKLCRETRGSPGPGFALSVTLMRQNIGELALLDTNPMPEETAR